MNTIKGPCINVGGNPKPMTKDDFVTCLREMYDAQLRVAGPGVRFPDIEAMIEAIDVYQAEAEEVNTSGRRCRLANAPVGLLRTGDGLIFKTEYHDGFDVIAYIVSSGEKFCGGDGTFVTPVEVK